MYHRVPATGALEVQLPVAHVSVHSEEVQDGLTNAFGSEGSCALTATLAREQERPGEETQVPPALPGVPVHPVETHLDEAGMVVGIAEVQVGGETL